MDQNNEIGEHVVHLHDRWYGTAIKTRAGASITAAFVVAVAAGYAWWATGRDPFTNGATAAVLGGGVGAVLAGLVLPRRRRRATPPSSLAAALGWALGAGALAGWQLLAYFQSPRYEHPTLSSLTNAVLDTHQARAIVFVAWLAAGLALARR